MDEDPKPDWPYVIMFGIWMLAVVVIVGMLLFS